MNDQTELFFNQCIRCKQPREWGEYNLNLPDSLETKVRTMLCDQCVDWTFEKAQSNEDLEALVRKAKGVIFEARKTSKD